MASNDLVISACGVGSPRIIYGTAWKEARTERLVRTAIGCGFRGIDTACQPKHYNEAGVGAAVSACLKEGLSRAELYLQTKFTPLPGHDPKRIPYDPAATPAQQVAQSFDTSLRNLQTGYVDCFVLHSPIADAREAAEVWGSMEAICDDGRAKRLGISNCYSLDYLEKLHRTARIKPAVVQNRFYAQTGHDRGIRAFCRQQGMAYQSFWTLTANPRVLADDGVKALAAKYARTPAQIFFRYLTQEGVIPLTGTTSPTHMHEDLAIFEFELTQSERSALSALL